MLQDHHPSEKDYYTEIEVQYPSNLTAIFKPNLLRCYPTKFNGCDAYVDFHTEHDPNFKTLKLGATGQVWRVIGKPVESPIHGYFRGGYEEGIPPMWMLILESI